MRMRSARDISSMIGVLEDSIATHGWDASIDAAARALSWAMGNDAYEATVLRYTDRPEAERRADWIVRGGKPEDWDAE